MGQEPGPQACPTFNISFQGLKPPASGSVDTYVKANLLPGASKVRLTPRHLLMPLGRTPTRNPRPVLPCPSPPMPGHQAWSSLLLGSTMGGSTREVGQHGALGPEEALIHPAGPPGQPAADPYGSGHKGACLGGDTHLPRLHPPGCWAEDSAVRIWPGPRGGRPRVGGAEVGRPCLARSDPGGHQAVCV